MKANTTEEKTPINYNVTDEAIKKLREKYSKVPSALTEDGYELCKSGAKEIRSIEIVVEKKRTELNREAQKHIKTVNSEAKRITALLVPIRVPLVEARAAVDEAKEKAARVEVLRQQGIQSRLDGMATMAGQSLGFGIDKLKEVIGKVEAINTAEGFDEFEDKGVEQKDKTLEKLNGLLNLAVSNKKQADEIEKLTAELAANKKANEPEVEEKRVHVEYGVPGLEKGGSVEGSSSGGSSLPEPSLSSSKKQSLPEPTLGGQSNGGINRATTDSTIIDAMINVEGMTKAIAKDLIKYINLGKVPFVSITY